MTAPAGIADVLPATLPTCIEVETSLGFIQSSNPLLSTLDQDEMSDIADQFGRAVDRIEHKYRRRNGAREVASC